MAVKVMDPRPPIYDRPPFMPDRVLEGWMAADWKVCAGAIPPESVKSIAIRARRMSYTFCTRRSV
jgi:hypothetical protein